MQCIKDSKGMKTLLVWRQVLAHNTGCILPLCQKGSPHAKHKILSEGQWGQGCGMQNKHYGKSMKIRHEKNLRHLSCCYEYFSKGCNMIATCFEWIWVSRWRLNDVMQGVLVAGSQVRRRSIEPPDFFKLNRNPNVFVDCFSFVIIAIILPKPINWVFTWISAAAVPPKVHRFWLTCPPNLDTFASQLDCHSAWGRHQLSWLLVT